jgi:MYXO-CTERM domain-containing protein
MKTLPILLLALVAAFTVPSFASAQSFILDTGAPTGSLNPILNSTSSYGAEFAANAGQDITLLSAYLTQGVGQSGTSFTFDIYSNAGLRENVGAARYYTSSYALSATFTGSGWSSAAANYVIPTTGDYWVTVQTTSGNTFDMPTESSATTGTVPALNFAFATTSNYYYTPSTTDPVGLEVTATPEPSTWALALLAVGGFAFLRRRAAVL